MNPAAFARPPEGQTRNFPVNGLRGEFSINQTDLALRRRFNLTELIELDLWEEYFNVFNHPMFGAPGSGASPFIFWGYGSTPNPFFGLTTPAFGGGTTNYALGGGVGFGQNALYAVGGPRSGQFKLNLMF